MHMSKPYYLQVGNGAIEVKIYLKVYLVSGGKEVSKCKLTTFIIQLINESCRGGFKTEWVLTIASTNTF